MKTLVMYVDGSARPNPGTTGFGVHAIVTNPKAKKKQILSKYIVTEQGYIPKQMFKTSKLKDTGIERIIDLYGYNRDSNTNNTAELDGLVNALDLYMTLKDKYFSDVEKIYLKLDSSYAISYYNKVIKNEPIVANPEYEVKIRRSLDNIDIPIEIIKVDGHSGNLGNDRADLLSNLGRLKNLRNETERTLLIKTRNEYWDGYKEREPFLRTKLIFNFGELPNLDSKKPSFLYMTNYKDETELGKKGDDIIYQIYYGINDDPGLLSIMEFLDKFFNILKVPYVINLDNVYNKQVYKNIELYGKDYILENKIGLYKILTIDNLVLAKQIYPPGLSFIVENNFKNMETLFKKYLINPDQPDKNVKVKNITDLLYEKDKKGKMKLKKEYVNDKGVITVDVKDIIPDMKYKLKLRFKYDLPIRNTLKKIENWSPRVDLVIEDYPNFITYRTITTYEKGKKKYSLYNESYYTAKQFKKIKHK